MKPNHMSFVVGLVLGVGIASLFFIAYLGQVNSSFKSVTNADASSHSIDYSLTNFSSALFSNVRKICFHDRSLLFIISILILHFGRLLITSQRLLVHLQIEICPKNLILAKPTCNESLPVAQQVLNLLFFR